MRPDPADGKPPTTGARPPEAAGGSTATRRTSRSRGHHPPRSQPPRGRKDREPDPGSDPGPAADPESFARQILLRRLTDQPRSRAELAEHLAARNVPDEVAASLLDRFERVGLVDDAEFARSWVRSRQRSRGLSGRVLAQELRRKGVDDDLVKEAVDEIDPDEEEAAARRLVRKKRRSMRGIGHDTQLRRLTAMLARKGYPSGLAFSVVREELDRAGQGHQDEDAETLPLTP